MSEEALGQVETDEGFSREETAMVAPTMDQQEHDPTLEELQPAHHHQHIPMAEVDHSPSMRSPSSLYSVPGDNNDDSTQQPSPSLSTTTPTNSAPPPPQLQSPVPGILTTSASIAIPPPKVNRICMKHPCIEVTLDGKELWDQFYQKGTEMIVNRSGRRMFPGFAVSIAGLKGKVKYTMKLDVVLADNHRFKFLNARWIAVGSSEPQSAYETYVHPDSGNNGSFWMRHGVSFRKLKITNNKDKPGQNALLHSMHKYYTRLVIEEERKAIPGEPKMPPRLIMSIEFPETTFIAVTAYQNEEVTQLKISNNPFAKAFRENAADMDWETAQALYSSPGYISGHGGSSSGSYYATSAWGMQSPLLSPTPLTPATPTLHHHTYQPQQHYPQHHHLQLHHQPLSAGSQGMQYSPDSPMLSKQVPSATGYFQWPTYKSETSTSPSCYQQTQAGYGVPPTTDETPTVYPAQQVQYSTGGTASQLPDFESVFTSPGTIHNVYNNPS